MERLIKRELGKTAAALSVEQIPELESAREQALDETEAIIESRRPDWEPGGFEPHTLPADPITAAERLLQAENNFGKDSHQYEQAHKAVLTDNRRALGEAYRKKSSEYFPALMQGYDSGSRLFTAFGRPIIEVVHDGLRWDKHPEERQRLANDYASELVIHEFADHELANTHWALTVSPCPDHAIANPNDNYGYVPEVEKMMIQGVFIQNSDQSPELKKRFTEQAAIPGKIIDMDIIHQTLEDLGAIEPRQRLSKTELHGTQFFISKEVMSSVLDFVELLDRTAGEGVFMGEWQPGKEPDYSAFKRQGKAREWLLEEQARELADYMMGLVRGEVDHVWAAGRIEQKVNDMIHERAKTEPRIAREAFDEQTAKGYEQAINMDREGKYKDAGDLRVKTQRQAPPAAYCGAGSCGLRQASPFEQTQGELLGLSGSLILDTVRLCPKGHSNAVLYDSKGSKACRQCKLVQKAGSKKVFKGKSDQSKLKHKNKKSSEFWS